MIDHFKNHAGIIKPVSVEQREAALVRVATWALKQPNPREALREAIDYLGLVDS